VPLVLFVADVALPEGGRRSPPLPYPAGETRVKDMVETRDWGTHTTGAGKFRSSFLARLLAPSLTILLRRTTSTDKSVIVMSQRPSAEIRTREPNLAIDDVHRYHAFALRLVCRTRDRAEVLEREHPYMILKLAVSE
jgi:hypothetical protein